MAEKKRKKQDVSTAIERLSGTIGMLQNRVNDLTNVLGRVVFPQEAMEDLIGELRTLRHLLDRDGQYSFLDRAKSKLERDKARAAVSPDPAEKPVDGAQAP